MVNTICDHPSLCLRVNDTSAQWRVDTFSKRHTAVLPLEQCRAVISKTTHFRCCTYWTKRAAWNEGHRGLSFTCIDTFFAKMYTPK